MIQISDYTKQPPSPIRVILMVLVKNQKREHLLVELKLTGRVTRNQKCTLFSSLRIEIFFGEASERVGQLNTCGDQRLAFCIALVRLVTSSF